jgi:hypothetical protein
LNLFFLKLIEVFLVLCFFVLLFSHLPLLLADSLLRLGLHFNLLGVYRHLSHDLINLWCVQASLSHDLINLCDLVTDFFFSDNIPDPKTETLFEHRPLLALSLVPRKLYIACFLHPVPVANTHSFPWLLVKYFKTISMLPENL